MVKLPGQKNRASELLTKTQQEVQEQSGKTILFLDITDYPDLGFNQLVRGYHESDEHTARVWLDPGLPYDAQEAVAAHELAHVLQEAAGFCRTASVKDARGNPLIPAIAELGVKIDNMIKDVLADQWAIDRGFKIGEALGFSISSLDFGNLKNKKPNKQEHMNWQAYYAGMDKIAKLIRSNPQIKGPLTVNPEVNTQILAVDYAGLNIRLSGFGQFTDLDNLWAEFWPESRLLGQKIAGIVEDIGTGKDHECQSATIAVIKYLNIHPALIYVEQPVTGEVIWSGE